MINESGTMSGGGGKPRGGRMCLGTASPRSIDTQAADAELQVAEQELSNSAQAWRILLQHQLQALLLYMILSSLQAVLSHGALAAQVIQALPRTQLAPYVYPRAI